ncbi:IS4 family transposase [Propionispira arboris]|uniref:IS4 family transposase n=1 Tax=Propionispira arboris TaxID=84035 RepID=UPI000B881BF1|nr:transposase [Propionispira arboris]
MNSCHTNWRKFTTLLSFSIIRHSIEPLTDEKRRNVLIIADSIFSRSRSKKVELLAKVFAHAHGLYTFGFRMLTPGWSDGNTFLPVSHCLLSTANQKNRINEASTKVDPRTNGGRQRKLAQLKATDVVLKLLKETKAAGISAQHVLFDTWFCAPASLTAIKDIGFDVIAMAKKTSKMHYRYQGKMQDVKAIYQQNTKCRGRAKYLLSVEAEAVKDGKALPVRYVYVHCSS